MPYKANIKLPNVRVYDVKRFDLRLGEKAVVELEGSGPIADWFANRDQVLKLEVAEDLKSATITATGKGKSEVQIQKPDRVSDLILAVEVFNEVAASLNPSAGTPELK